MRSLGETGHPVLEQWIQEIHVIRTRDAETGAVAFRLQVSPTDDHPGFFQRIRVEHGADAVERAWTGLVSRMRTWLDNPTPIDQMGTLRTVTLSGQDRPDIWNAVDHGGS